MARRNFRTEISQLSNENLIWRISKLKDILLTHLGLGDGNYIQKHSIYRNRRMLDYAEQVLEKRLRVKEHKQRVDEMKEKLNTLTILK